MEKLLEKLAKSLDDLNEKLGAKFSEANPKASNAETDKLIETYKALEKKVEDMQKAKAVQKMVFGIAGKEVQVGEKLVTFGGFLKGIASRDPEFMAMLKTGNGQNENVSADGLYTVPTDWSNEIIKLQRLYGVARQIGRLVPMSTKVRNINRQLTHPTATYTDEAVAHTKSKMTFDQLVQTAKKLSCVIPMTEEWLEDSTPGADTVIFESVARAFAYVEDAQAFAGTGSPFTGVLTTSGIATAVQGGANPNFDDLVETMMSVAAGYRSGGTWLLDSVGLKLAMKIKDGNGVPIWTSPIAGAPGTILGKPYRETEAFSSQMIFGDFSYLWISDRSSYEVKASTDASDASGGAGSAFLQDEVWYKFRQRHSINTVKGEAFAKMVLTAA